MRIGATSSCSDDKSDMIAERRGQRGGGKMPEISNSSVESASARLRSCVGLLND